MGAVYLSLETRKTKAKLSATVEPILLGELIQLAQMIL